MLGILKLLFSAVGVKLATIAVLCCMFWKDYEETATNMNQAMILKVWMTRALFLSFRGPRKGNACALLAASTVSTRGRVQAPIVEYQCSYIDSIGTELATGTVN